MSENVDSDVLLELLNRTPGATMCGRMNLATGASTWRFFSAKAAELYEVPEAEVRADPDKLLSRVLPEDRARLDQQTAKVFESGGVMAWTGRIQRRDGGIRWLETQTSFVHHADGSLVWYTQALDVTERRQLEQSLADSEAARSRSESLYRQIIDALPVGVLVANPAHEFVVMNPAAERNAGTAREDYTNIHDVAAKIGLFKADGVTPIPTRESGLGRALRGETLEEEVVIRNPRIVGDLRIHAVWKPLLDQNGKIFAALGVTQDITLQRALQYELRSRNEELAASESSKAQLIERLRYSIDELSNPILEVWDDVLAMPIIGVVDSRRTMDMVQRLLGEVSRTQASFVIIDLTGVEIVDTKTADHLMKLMRKVEVVGARCVLTGIRPAVAETLVDIGVDFGRLTTLRNLKHGLREALRLSRRERGGAREIDIDDANGEDARAQRRAGLS